MEKKMVINSQVPTMAYRGVLILVASMAVITLLAACGGEDRPGVEVLNESESKSISQSASKSVSKSVTMPGDNEVEGAIGGYMPASNVVSHSLVVNDVV